MKVCLKCQVEKDDSEFGMRKRNGSYKVRYKIRENCNKCVSEINLNHYHEKIQSSEYKTARNEVYDKWQKNNRAARTIYSREWASRSRISISTQYTIQVISRTNNIIPRSEIPAEMIELKKISIAMCRIKKIIKSAM